jgi:hypothetical protein
MTHVQPKEIVTVQYLGDVKTRFTPFLGGEKVDIQPNEKVEMDARQAAVVLIDHLRWKKIGDAKKAEPKEEEKEEKPKSKKTK